MLAWGLGEADKVGLPVYLEASRVGEPLYSRYGFERGRRVPFDSLKYGGEKAVEHVIMIRPARERGVLGNGGGGGGGSE